MEHLWYRNALNFRSILLMPLSGVFRILVALRRLLYRQQIIKTHRFSAPVIVVGNITVGGTGKTPFVIWLANFLKSQGFQPGIVSRGVGGKQEKQPRWVDIDSDPKQVGDEAVLLRRNTNCQLVIGTDRVAAVKTLLAKTHCDVVISDDGLQHYRMGRDLEIVIVDGARGFGNKCYLPAGPLRESPKRLREVDFVVTQVSSQDNLQMDSASIARLREKKEETHFEMQLQGDILVLLLDEHRKIPLKHFHNIKVHAVAAVGNPKRFFESLRYHGLDIVEHIFPDHYLYKKDDFNFADNLPIVMTEKDAVKCQGFADERFWYLPVITKIDNSFMTALLKRVLDKGLRKTQIVS